MSNYLKPSVMVRLILFSSHSVPTNIKMSDDYQFLIKVCLVTDLRSLKNSLVILDIVFSRLLL